MGKFEYKYLDDIKNLLLIFRCDNVTYAYLENSFFLKDTFWSI